MGFLAGKRFLIVGIASDRSIATGIAAAMHREGAELAFTYQNVKLKSRVLKAAERYGSNQALCFPCDVASDEQIQQVFEGLGKQWDGHSQTRAVVSGGKRNALSTATSKVATQAAFSATTVVPGQGEYIASLCLTRRQ